MCHRARLWQEICSVRPTHCAAILVYCSVRDWTRLILHHRIRKNPDSPVHTLSDLLQIYFFSTLESISIFSGFAVEFAGCVWTVAISGKKKLRIQKYPAVYLWTGPKKPCGKNRYMGRARHDLVPRRGY